MKNDSATGLLKKLESGYSLPPLSVVALKLVELASSDTCSVNDLAGLIEKDPSLAVRLLKLANSAFFQSHQPIATLKQAVVKVGLHRLRIMALSLSLRDTFPMGKVGALDYERFWCASLYRALLAKSLAQHLKTCNPEEAFVAGLILEIGLLIFFDVLIKGKGDEANIDVDDLEDFLAWERDRYGMDHRQVGEVVLRYWKFPESIVGCQPVYGKPAVGSDAFALAKICEMARQFSKILFRQAEEFQSLFVEAYGFQVSLKPGVINDILVTTFDQVQGIADQFKLELNKEKDLMGVMEKANTALSQISEKMTKLQATGPERKLPTFENLNEKGDGITDTLQAVAHEIRNPLTAVGGFAKKLVASLDPSTEGGKYAQAILEEAVRLEKALSEMTRDEKGLWSSTT